MRNRGLNLTFSLVLSLSEKRRLNEELDLEILSAVASGSILITRIISRVFIAYNQLVPKIERLKYKGLLIQNTSTGEFSLTPRGMNALEHYKEIKALITTEPL